MFITFDPHNECAEVRRLPHAGADIFQLDDLPGMPTPFRSPFTTCRGNGDYVLSPCHKKIKCSQLTSFILFFSASISSLFDAWTTFDSPLAPAKCNVFQIELLV